MDNKECRYGVRFPFPQIYNINTTHLHSRKATVDPYEPIFFIINDLEKLGVFFGSRFDKRERDVRAKQAFGFFRERDNGQE